MLHASKREVQASLHNALVSIEQKELAYYFDLLQQLSTIAGQISFFAIGSFYGNELLQVDIKPGSASNDAMLHAVVVCSTAATMLPLAAVFRATQLCVMGPGLGICGPNGSMTRAVIIMRAESREVYWMLVASMLLFLASIVPYLYVLFRTDTTKPIPIIVLSAIGLAWIVLDYRRLERKLRLPSPLRPTLHHQGR